MIMAQAKLPQIQSYDPVEEKINALSGKIGMLAGISSKVVYGKKY